jgi:hypothetical protein
MAWDRNEGWPSFEREATTRLRLGTDLLRGPGRRLVQVVVLPAFSNTESWEVFAARADADPAGQRRYTVLRRIWRLDRDYPDIDSPDYTGPDTDEPGFQQHIASLLPSAPTIEEATFTVPAAGIDEILRPLSQLHLPLVPAEVEEGNDGVGIEVQLGGFFGWARLGWWCEGPREWREVTHVVGKLLEYLAATSAS